MEGEIYNFFRLIPQSKADYDRMKYILESRTFYPKDIPDLYLTEQDKIDGKVNPATIEFDYRQLFIYMWPLVEETGFLIHTRDNISIAQFRETYITDEEWITRYGLENVPGLEFFEYTDIVNGRRTMTGKLTFLSWDYQLHNNI